MSASDVESSGLPSAGVAPAQQAHRGALGSRTPVAFALIGACVMLWGLGLWWGNGSDSVLWYLGANNGRAVGAGEVYRLLSCLFLHLGWVHLLLNMIALRALSTLELVLGGSRFLLLFALSGLGASVSTAWLNPEVLSVGASGAIWGLMGAAFGMRIPIRHVLRARGVRLTSGWPALALNLAISFLPGVDLTAHLGGGLVGFVLGATAFYPDLEGSGISRSGRRRAPLWVHRVGALGAALALVTAVAAALIDGRPWRLNAAPRLVRVAVPESSLSLELPELIAAEVEPMPTGRRGWQFGVPGRAPLSVSVRIHDSLEPLARARSQAEIESYLQAVHDQIERSPMDPELPRTALERVVVGDRLAVRDEYRNSRLRMVRYLSFAGPDSLTLQLIRGQTPPSELSPSGEVWPGVEERIAASLRHDAR